MDEALLAQLERLPRLDADAARAQALQCKLCGAPAPLFDVVDLQKHCAFDDQYKYGLSGVPVPYHRCANCSFLFTGFFDDWPSEAFARFIYNDDYIKVDPEYAGARPQRLAAIAARLLHGCQALRILDYGSGSGIFAEDMRRAGFGDTEAYDPFSSPAPPSGLFDVITCFEVLEHTPQPDRTIGAMQALLRPGGCLIFSQSVQPANIGDIRGAWWYLAPRNGHISMFTVETLWRLLPAGQRLHGNGWLWAMAPASPDPGLLAALDGISPPIACVRLGAPRGDDDRGGHEAGGWHEAAAWYPEEAGPRGRFRWSRADRLAWPVAVPGPLPCRLRLRIPFLLEVEPGFAARCRVTLGGAAAKVSVSADEIVAEIDVQAGARGCEAVLWTPAPASPFDLRGAPDARRLGLAVAVA